MANKLAHQINNPLQSMTNAAYMVEKGSAQYDQAALGHALSQDIRRLSDLVQELLALPLK